MSATADNPNPDATLTLTPADIAALLDKLGLDPATTDVAAVLAKIDALNGAATDAQAATDTAQTAQASLADLKAQYDAKIAEYDGLQQQLQAKSTELEGIYKQRNEAEADGILAQYATLFPSGDAGDKAKATLRALLLSDRTSAVTILDGMKRDAAEAGETKTGTPPAPVHDPGNTAAENANTAPTEDQIAAATSKLAKQLMSANAQLRREDAWAKAEKQIRDKVAAGQSIS